MTKFLLPILVFVGAVSASGQSASFWTEDIPNQKSRQALAREWLVGFSRLDAAIPTLSPSQRAWLATEFDREIQNAGGKYTARSIAATDSLEYQIRVAKPHVQEMILALRPLAASPIDDPKQEALLWITVSSRIIDREFWQAVSHLIERKIVATQVNGVDGLYFENHVLWARTVLDKAVVPLLGNPSQR